MITIKQNDQVYEIYFKYDPTLINLIKLVPGSHWIPSSKHWIIPKDKLGFLLGKLKGTMYEDVVNILSDEEINKNAAMESDTKIPNFQLPESEKFLVKAGSKPFKHQIDFMKWSLYRQYVENNRHGFILADEQGLAKTCELMNLAIHNRKYLRFKRCLIICCVNAAKYHWKSDIIEHTQGKYHPYILGSRKKRNGSYRYDIGSKEKLEDLSCLHVFGNVNNSILPYFLIINVESLRYRNKNKFPIADAIIQLINSGEISMVAIDEVHKNTSPTSLQGKQIIRIKKETKDRAMWIPITGTPIVSKPTDVYLPLKLVDGHSYSSYYSWNREFCISSNYGQSDIIGYKNIPYLKQLVECNMIRRLKSNVLDLPPKLYYTEYVENTPYQRKLYNDVVEDVITNREQIVSSLNPLSKLLRLREVNGFPEAIDDSITISDSTYSKYNAKYARLLDILSDIHERKEKVIIYSNWIRPLKTLYQLLSSKYNICVYTGELDESTRNEQKDKFLHDDNYTVFLGTIGALGIMHTLTVANNIIFYDEPWTAVDKVQAEDRVHRISATCPINIYTLITKSTIDERVHEILYKKQAISNYIVDNIDIYSNPELFNLLLSDSIK